MVKNTGQYDLAEPLRSIPASMQTPRVLCTTSARLGIEGGATGQKWNSVPVCQANEHILIGTA